MGASASIPTSSFKDNGDKAFSEGRYLDSILEYSYAINNEYALISNDIDIDIDEKIDDNIVYDNLEEINNRLRSRDILSKLFSNRSASFLLIDQPSKALADALSCIEIDSTWFKGYLRASNAYRVLEKNEESKISIFKAIALCPNDDNLLKIYDEIVRNENNNNDSISNKIYDRRSIGQVYTWGAGKKGCLGLGNEKHKSFPTIVDGLCEKHILDIAAGAMHSLCLTSSGDVFVFGNNSHNQLGLIDKEYVLTPTLLPRLVGIKVVAVACGSGHSIAVANDGKAFSWGIGKQGQLGLGNDINVKEPKLLSLNGVKSVSCGIAHSFFLLKDGNLFSCGLNSYGQLGLGLSEQCVLTPTEVKIVGVTNETISHISCGGGHTLLIMNNKVYGTGSNSCKQLGIDDVSDLYEFKLIIALTNVEAAFVACGEEFSSVISKSKLVYMWGLTVHDGQLESRSTPSLIRDFIDIESIHCSQKLILAISNGDVYSWGVVDDEMPNVGFGIDKTAVTKKPEKVKTFGKHKRIRSLACGRRHFIGITISAYAPYCVVTNGLEEGELTEVSCDKKLKFKLKSYDTNGEPLDSGGHVFRMTIKHEISDYDIKLKKLRAIDDTTKKNLEDDAFIDDNLDGTYDGFIKFLFAGKYSIKITLNELEIKNSPFDINCLPGKICAPSCISYYGKFADFDTLLMGTVKLICNSGDAMVFTVSCYDKYGNKCINTDNTSITVICDNDIENYISSETYEKASNGIFVCVLHAPKELGTYRVSVVVNGGNNHIRGSPYNLTVNELVINNDNNNTNSDDNQIQIIENTVKANDIVTNEEDKKIVTLTKMEITRQRGLDALRKKLNLIKFEKQKKIVKRVGGGFCISYSKEI